MRAILALPVLVVLDEAYIEFSSEPSKIKWVQQHDNLVVLRTFSKSAGELLHAFILGAKVEASVQLPRWQARRCTPCPRYLGTQGHVG